MDEFTIQKKSQALKCPENLMYIVMMCMSCSNVSARCMRRGSLMPRREENAFLMLDLLMTPTEHVTFLAC